MEAVFPRRQSLQVGGDHQPLIGVGCGHGADRFADALGIDAMQHHINGARPRVRGEQKAQRNERCKQTSPHINLKAASSLPFNSTDPWSATDDDGWGSTAQAWNHLGLAIPFIQKKLVENFVVQSLIEGVEFQSLLFRDANFGFGAQ